ncbi:methionine aminopeptidase 2 [Penicillium soppii]|uniref:methionine aminopeptidase 2 n=1 Tax=Penicillium soppii TaxID=69789 RepID=UPI002546748A|nr:methionine aminopeptidase 2 [Penicillium soppii]KAJ5861072.1 methionine aminopeptidase 2 [Penicillium soppii]
MSIDPELLKNLEISVAGENGADTSVSPPAVTGTSKETEDSDDDVAEDSPAVAAGNGEEVEYKDDNLWRTTNEEKRYLDNLNSDFLSDYRQAAEAHRQVRQWAQRSIKPGQTLLEIANGIEDSARRLVGHDGLTEGDSLIAGMGFPTGLNIDNVVAHYSPNAGCKTVLAQNNVLKVDIGIHVGGRIVDSAFTMAFDPVYDNLLEAVKDATNTGVREAGIDVRVGELGGLIQEAMESYECEINGKVHPIKAIRNLCGHTILPYSIHGTKSVPFIKSDDMTKMEEGDVFAIETFGSTGSGRYVEGGEVSHYALRGDANPKNLALSSAKSVLGAIKKNFSTIPFCRRYLDRIGQEKYLLGLNSLVKSGIVEDYPPLNEKEGTYTAQFEHTILLRPNIKEVISRGDDF